MILITCTGSILGGNTGGSQLRVDSITQTVKSALYQSLLPRGLMNSVVDTDRVSIYII